MLLLRELLREKGLKVTPQRLAILQTLKEGGHLSIEEIYQKLYAQFPSLSLATIYKNLHLLLERGIITELAIHNRHKFEIVKEPHSHFICEKCGKIEDIHLSPEICEKLNQKFPDSRQEVYIYGICPRCRGEKGEKE
ncbi:MAG: transcriptional repressor [Epsilonproteobacteria bacterium]|nr:transcriptional repressor [Campylobacterota bacterium]NPA89292.1 transcriptional repressor [Campylobacterota bacterium]